MKTIGVIGLGSIGMRHARNLQAMGYDVRAYDPDKKKRLESIGTIDEVLDSDAIVIASPTKYHFHHLHVALSEGKPTFIEKPISHEMIGLSPEVGAKLMVGYNLRFHSCVKKAKEWLDAGFIGRPLWANFTCAQWNDKPAYLRDGVILNWSHEIDLALYLLGGASVAASSTRLTEGKDDMTDILLTHVDGCRSSIHLDYLTNPEHRYFKIIGTLGDMHVDLVERYVFLKTEANEEHLQFLGEDSFDENYVEEMQAFIDRIGGKKTIGCTGAEALKVLEVCLEVRKQAGLV